MMPQHTSVLSKIQSGKSGTIRELNQASGVSKAQFTVVVCTKKLHIVSGNWCKENKFCGMWIQLYQNPFFLLPEKFNQQNKLSLCIFQ